MHDSYLRLKAQAHNKNLITVFYECGSGGEFLVWLLGLHHDVAARNISVNQYNQWITTDSFGSMAGRGLDQSINNWMLTEENKWYITRDHANLLYPTEKWQDNLKRSLAQGIEDFNNIYSSYWKSSKTIWLDIENVNDLRFIDRMGAIKNFQQEHIHYTDSQYLDRYRELKARLSTKQERFSGETLKVNVGKLWHTDTKAQLENICNFLDIEKNFIDIWILMIQYWNDKNKLLVCKKHNCVPIGL